VRSCSASASFPDTIALYDPLSFANAFSAIIGQISTAPELAPQLANAGFP
jgi:hypothetical protein